MSGAAMVDRPPSPPTCLLKDTEVGRRRTAEAPPWLRTLAHIGRLTRPPGARGSWRGCAQMTTLLTFATYRPAEATSWPIQHRRPQRLQPVGTIVARVQCMRLILLLHAAAWGLGRRGTWTSQGLLPWRLPDGALRGSPGPLLQARLEGPSLKGRQWIPPWTVYFVVN